MEIINFDMIKEGDFLFFKRMQDCKNKDSLVWIYCHCIKKAQSMMISDSIIYLDNYGIRLDLFKSKHDWIKAIEENFEVYRLSEEEFCTKFGKQIITLNL